jgi:hypothetical protein
MTEERIAAIWEKYRGTTTRNWTWPSVNRVSLLGLKPPGHRPPPCAGS